MASGDTTTPPHAAVSMEVPLKTSAPPPDSSSSRGGSFKKHTMVDVLLRIFLFATALVAVVVMVTSEETKMIPVAPGVAIKRDAKFNYSPAYIYFVAALSVATLYSIITGLVSVLALIKGGNSAKLQFHFVILDSLLLGIVAAATGASGGVGYIGLKGNSHTGWNKICNRYGSYCAHFKASILLSLISAITLLLLVWLSVYVLSKKIARR